MTGFAQTRIEDVAPPETDAWSPLLPAWHRFQRRGETAHGDRSAALEGIGLLVFWMVTVALGFWFVFLRSNALPAVLADADAVQAELEAWFRAASESSVAEGVGARVLFFPSACACPKSDADEFATLAARWRSSGVVFEAEDGRMAGEATNAAASVRTRRGSRPPLPNGVDLLVFSGSGTLAYAGPLHATEFCSTSGGLVDWTLNRLKVSGASSIRPVLLQASCTCSA